MLINSKYLKIFSPIPLNYNMDEVNNYIDIAEKIWILPIIGDEFYDELQVQVDTVSGISEENQTLLLEALYPYLAYAVVLEALPFIWSDVSEKGITLGKSDASDSITLKDLTYIETHLRKQVEVRKDFFIKYLKSHLDSFPLFCGCGDSCCCDPAKLNKPNPLFEVYTTYRKNTNLR